MLLLISINKKCSGREVQLHMEAALQLQLLFCYKREPFCNFNCCYVCTAACSNEALFSPLAALEVRLAQQGKQSRHGKPGGQLAEPSGVQVALQSQLEGTWSPLGRQLEAIWTRFGSLLQPKFAKRRPEAPQGAQEAPS